MVLSLPDFAPNHAPGGGQHGRRPWYRFLLFPAGKGSGGISVDEVMTYQSIHSLCFR